MGLGVTFYSGAIDVWLVDALNAAGYRGQLDQVFARGSIATVAAILLGPVSGGLLAQINLTLPYIARALMLVVFVVAFATMREFGFTLCAMHLSDLPRDMRRVARDSIAHGWQTRSVRLVMGCNFIQWGFISWDWATSPACARSPTATWWVT